MADPISGKRQGDPTGEEEERYAKKMMKEAEEIEVRRMKQTAMLLALNPGMEEQSKLMAKRLEEEWKEDRVLYENWFGKKPKKLEPKDKEYRRPDPDPATTVLPKGHGWGTYFFGDGTKDFITKMYCARCGVGLDHFSWDCPQPNPEYNKPNAFAIAMKNMEVDPAATLDAEDKLKRKLELRKKWDVSKAKHLAALLPQRFIDRLTERLSQLSLTREELRSFTLGQFMEHSRRVTPPSPSPPCTPTSEDYFYY